MGRYVDQDLDDDQFWRDELRHLRNEAGISIRQLSHATDVSPEQIQRFEKGLGGMPIARLERVFAIFGYELELMRIHPGGEDVDTSWIKEL